MITRKQVAEMAASYCGTPFLHQGREPGLGLDCAGIPVCAAGALGVPVEDYREYRGIPNSRVLLERMRRVFDEIDPLEADTGDILVRSVGPKNYPRHLGVLTERGVVSVENGGKVVELCPLPAVWRDRTEFAFRIRGVA